MKRVSTESLVKMGVTLMSCALIGALTVSTRAAQSAPSPQTPTERKLTPREMQEERAQLLMLTKRYDLAIAAYQSLSKASPKNPQYLNMIGIAYLDLGNFNQSIKYFQRAAKVDKKFSSAVNNIGMIYYEKKNYGRAIKEYQRAIKIDPSQSAMYANLGYAYYNSGKYDEAFAQFHKAIAIDPRAFEHNERVGTMLEDRSVTNHGLFFFLMAREYAKVGDAEHCAEYLKKSLEEGYPKVASAATAPEFQAVINDPMVQAVLSLIPPPAGTSAPDGAANTTNSPPA